MRYILLNSGDIVCDGDEEYSAIENELIEEDIDWRPVAVEFIGEGVQETDPPIRRLISKNVERIIEKECLVDEENFDD